MGPGIHRGDIIVQRSDMAQRRRITRRMVEKLSKMLNVYSARNAMTLRSLIVLNKLSCQQSDQRKNNHHEYQNVAFNIYQKQSSK